MELKNQVISFEQAKQLADLGIEQTSHFYFVPWKASDFDGCFICSKCNKGFFHSLDGELETLDGQIYYSAFTVSELTVMLGRAINVQGYHNPTLSFTYAGSRNPALFKNQAESYADQLINALNDGYTTSIICNKLLLES